MSYTTQNIFVDTVRVGSFFGSFRFAQTGCVGGSCWPFTRGIEQPALLDSSSSARRLMWKNAKTASIEMNERKGS